MFELFSTDSTSSFTSSKTLALLNNLSLSNLLVYEPSTGKDLLSLASFIIFSSVDHENRKLIVNMLIPCPYWDSKQISANELKKSLLSLASESDAELDLQPLYDSDIRIKMDWTYFN